MAFVLTDRLETCDSLFCLLKITLCMLTIYDRLLCHLKLIELKLFVNFQIFASDAIFVCGNFVHSATSYKKEDHLISLTPYYF